MPVEVSDDFGLSRSSGYRLLEHFGGIISQLTLEELNSKFYIELSM